MKAEEAHIGQIVSWIDDTNVRRYGHISGLAINPVNQLIAKVTPAVPERIHTMVQEQRLMHFAQLTPLSQRQTNEL